MARNVGANVSKSKRRFIYYLYDNQCLICGANTDLSLDHITPRVLGGTSELENLAVLCSSCNSEKAGNGIEFYSEEEQLKIQEIQAIILRAKEMDKKIRPLISLYTMRITTI